MWPTRRETRRDHEMMWIVRIGAASPRRATRLMAQPLARRRPRPRRRQNENDDDAMPVPGRRRYRDRGLRRHVPRDRRGRRLRHRRLRRGGRIYGERDRAGRAAPRARGLQLHARPHAADAAGACRSNQINLRSRWNSNAAPRDRWLDVARHVEKRRGTRRAAVFQHRS